MRAKASGQHCFCVRKRIDFLRVSHLQNKSSRLIDDWDPGNGELRGKGVTRERDQQSPRTGEELWAYA